MRANHDLLREYAQLDRRRKDDGITQLEFQRWLDLRERLERAFPGKSALGIGGNTRICVEFASPVALTKAVMMNLRPVGLFVLTPFALEEGTRFELRVTVEETREVFDSPVVVVSQNVGPEFSTTALGMGCALPAPCVRCARDSRSSAVCKRRRKRGRRAASDNEASLRRAYRRRTRNLDGSRSADRTRAARPRARCPSPRQPRHPRVLVARDPRVGLAGSATTMSLQILLRGAG